MPKPRWDRADPVILDGRTLEGGGQLLRNALCLSALTGIPVKIHNIRGNRSGGGGLKAQHLACVRWLAHASRARVEGAEIRSKTLVLEPGKAKAQDEGGAAVGPSPAFKKVMADGEPVFECRLDIGTAGSTGLALQAILPFILFSDLPAAIPIRLTLSGGTNVSASPSYEYITQVLLPTLNDLGFPPIWARLAKRGWSQGGSSIGNFTLEIPPRERNALPAFRLKPTESEQGGQRRIASIQATFIAPLSCHEHFRKALTTTVKRIFVSLPKSDLLITCESSLHEKRMYLILVATISSNEGDGSSRRSTHRLGSDWLYDRKIRSPDLAATEMVESVTRDLANAVNSGAFVDVHLRDQLVIFQALAQGRSEVYPGVDDSGRLLRPSLHARTAEWVTTQLLGVEFEPQGRCEGAGFGAEGEEEGLTTNVDGTDDVGRELEGLGVT